MLTTLRTAFLTLLALLAFASNSLLTRLALNQERFDAGLFSAIRLGSGALMLVLLVRARAGSFEPLRGRGVVGPLALFLYAAPFSFAYVRIGAAAGALILFGVVQLTMIGFALVRGEHPSVLSWLGLSLATLGLVVLTAPSAAGADALGFLLMAVAGVAWAAYTIVGRSASDALAVNARSFLLSTPLAILCAALSQPVVPPSSRGVLLAVTSGAVTSGLGYAVWYRVLPRLSVTQAAVAQLMVPVIAALGAVALLGEKLSPRVVVAGALVLGGVSLVLLARARRR